MAAAHIDHFPHLHARPARGWVNDPNGIGRWDGRWHVMYQWNPSAPEHRDIHWGHMSSRDLLSWRDEGAALSPRPGHIDAAGVWSGVAVRDTAGVALVYTAVRGDAGSACVAVARPGAHGTWVQPDRAAAEHPDHDRWVDVRDPFLVSVEGRRLGLMGAGVAEVGSDRLAADGPVAARCGAVLVYDADDLDDWKLLGALIAADDLPDPMIGAGVIWECPQLVPIEDRWLLVVSWDAGASAQRQGVTGYVGDLDISGPVPRFTATTETPFDRGPDFYAPQLVVDGDRVLAWGWSWEGRGTGTNRRSDAEIAASGWAGTLTFPREVGVDPSGGASCVPAPDLAGLIGDPLEVRVVDGGWEVRTSAPAWRFDTTVDTMVEGVVEVVVDVVVDVVDESSGQARSVWAGYDRGPVTVFVDGSIVEVFDRTGSTTLRAYPSVGEVWRVRSTGRADAVTLRVPDQR